MVPLYSKLIESLGSAYKSPAMAALLAGLPGKKNLHKDGGYQASLSFKPQGLYCIFDWHRPDWILVSAMLFPEGVDGFTAFAEPIEGRLAISSDRSAVHRAFGKPRRSGGTGLPGPVAGLKEYLWDRYDFPKYSLRFDYESAEGMIHLTTLMTA